MSAATASPVPAGGTAPMRIMLASSTLWVGGAEVVIKHLARHLDPARFTVTVCHLKERGTIGDELAAGGVDVVGIDREGGRVDYLTSLKLRRIIRERRIQLVHSHMTHSLVDASICRLVTPGLKVLHTFHFGNYPHAEGNVLRLERMFARVPQRLFAVGEHQRQQIRRVFGFADHRIATIRNGVEVPPPRLPDTDTRRRLGGTDRPIVGTIATYIEQKGLPDLLDVAARVRSLGGRAAFAVVGEGHLRPQLEARRRALGLDDVVSFTGWIPNAADTVLPSIDVFFQPSRWEAMSMVVLEAMAAARPVVVTEVGENGFMVDHDRTGMLVRPGDVDGMANALMELLADPARSAAMGAAARQAVETRFTAAHMVRAYEAAYTELLS